MTTTKEVPFFSPDWRAGSNQASYQIRQLVRSGKDARRLLVPIRERAMFCQLEHKAIEVEHILADWDNQTLLTLGTRALVLLDELHEAFSNGHGVDMMALAEVRVPLFALQVVIADRMDELTAEAESESGDGAPLVE